MKRSTDGRLAALLLGSLLIAATPAALGDDSPAAQGQPASEPAQATRSRAADAHEEAVAKAASAVVSATKLDLDIRLVSHTSIQVASDLR